MAVLNVEYCINCILARESARDIVSAAISLA